MTSTPDPSHAEMRTLTAAQIDGIVAAMQKAGDAFSVTRSESVLYALLRAVVWSAALSLPLVVLGTALLGRMPGAVFLMVVGVILLLVDGIAAPLLLAANGRLMWRLFRQHLLLRRAGLGDAARAVWTQHARGTRRRLDRWFLVIVAVGDLVCAWLAWQRLAPSLSVGGRDPWLWFVMFVLVGTSATILAALLVQRRKEELEIVASANTVRDALSRTSEVVPVSILETAARIEGAEIARARARAVVAANVKPRRYAVTFDAAADAERANLSAESRVALQGFIDSLMTQSSLSAGGGGAQIRLGQRRLEIHYVVDTTTRLITIDRLSDLGPTSSPSGNRDAT